MDKKFIDLARGEKQREIDGKIASIYVIEFW